MNINDAGKRKIVRMEEMPEMDGSKSAVKRGMNRELLLMCERNQIAIAVPKVEVKT